MLTLTVLLTIVLTAAGGSVLATPKRLVEQNKPLFTITVLGEDASARPLMDRAAAAIADTVRNWSGAQMTVHSQDRPPSGPSLVLATLDSLPPELRSRPDIGRVELMDGHGFGIGPVEGNLYIVSRTPRGVYNGAVYLRDFQIDGPADALTVEMAPVFRTPWMKGRPVYLLNIWGHEQLYTVEDWKTILDSFARDGFETVYFWTSGHFPSKKFPQAYRWNDHGFDTTEDTRIGAVEDLAAIISHGHSLGMKMYLGGGLGAWSGTGNLTSLKPGTMKTGKGDAPMSLCPSHPDSRKALVEYYREMFDALPEADGVYIEMADEFGECECEVCSRPVDNLGSRQYGQSQLSLIQEIARSIWQAHPHARFAFTNGYPEHASDPAFYEGIRQMDNGKIEWMEARGSWEFPGPDGKPMPASYFTRHQMKWRIWERDPLTVQIEHANRIAREGWYGMIADFSPGFATGSLYAPEWGTDSGLPVTIPFPVDRLPHVLTYFVTREVMWEPTLSVDQVKERVRKRFFGSEAPVQLVEDLWNLREIILECSKNLRLTGAQQSALEAMESRIREASSSASPKTRETIGLMRDAIAHTRKHTRPE